MTLFYLIHKQNIIQTLQYNNINDNNNNNNDDNDNNNIKTNKVKKERYNFFIKLSFSSTGQEISKLQKRISKLLILIIIIIIKILIKKKKQDKKTTKKPSTPKSETCRMKPNI